MEYWKWPESTWTSEKFDWKKAEKITAGVDIGTTSSQAAIFCDGKLFGYSNIYTGADIKKTADRVFAMAAGASGMTPKDVTSAAGTGWGGERVSYANITADEISCHAKGARFMFGPEARTVVDLGSQTCKAIHLYDWDRVRDFMMNDKCATGMGRSIEMMADILQIPIDKMGEMSLQAEKEPEPVSTTCYAFANTEAIGLLRPEFKGDTYTINEILASYLFTIAWRILSTIGKLQPLDVGDITVYKELAFTGGLAKNPGIVKRLERELNVNALKSEYDPQLAGAIGAALIAAS